MPVNNDMPMKRPVRPSLFTEAYFEAFVNRYPLFKRSNLIVLLTVSHNGGAVLR